MNLMELGIVSPLCLTETDMFLYTLCNLGNPRILAFLLLLKLLAVSHHVIMH